MKGTTPTRRTRADKYSPSERDAATYPTHEARALKHYIKMPMQAGAGACTRRQISCQYLTGGSVSRASGSANGPCELSSSCHESCLGFNSELEGRPCCAHGPRVGSTPDLKASQRGPSGSRSRAPRLALGAVTAPACWGSWSGARRVSTLRVSGPGAAVTVSCRPEPGTGSLSQLRKRGAERTALLFFQLQRQPKVRASFGHWHAY